MHPKYAALFTSVNLLLGAGPLILPAPYFEAGIGLSTIWVIIIVGISYNSALFIAQAMAKIYYIKLQKKGSLIVSVISDIENETENKLPIKQQQTQNKEDGDIETYDHNQQLQILYGKTLKYLVSIAITVYVGGTCISKCIMTSKTLSKVFQSVQVLSSLQFWLALFFVISAAFSFRSIQKTAGLQTIIIGVRTISIALMVFGALYIIIIKGVQDLTPTGKGAFNVSNFTEIFSNSVFALMFHHSFPGIAGQVKNSQDLKFFLRWAFIISGSILIIIPITGIMAFGNSLGSGTDGDLRYYNFDFENDIPFIYYFVSFYVFLNIAAFPVYVIVMRSNILKIAGSQVDPKKFSKTTFGATMVILSIVLVISFFAKNQIQIVLDFTGGIFGIMILFMVPALQVWKSRQLTYKKGTKRNYIRWLPLFIIAIGFIFMGFNLFQIISKMIK